MWLFTRYGFFSVVNGRRPNRAADPHTVMVRARRMAHLRNLQARFPALAAYRVATTPDHDYRYRIVLPKADWLPVLNMLGEEQNWTNFKAETSRHLGPAGADYVHALHRVWSVMHELQSAEPRFALINRDAGGAITNPDDLAAEDVVGEKAWCPACAGKLFACWPEGWDGHAAHACTIEGETPEERKANFKARFRHLFR